MKRVRSQEEFLSEYKNIEIPDDLDPSSTWEGRTTDSTISPLVLKRYLGFLKKTNLILYITAFILLVAALGMTYKFAFQTNYNFYIFSDGTDATCILDPKSGVIKQNVQ